MRIVALAVSAVIALVAAAALILLPAWRSSSFQAALPAIPPATPLPPLPSPSSTVIVPIEVRLDGIARHLNARLRRSGAEEEENFARDLLRDDRMAYSWTRGDLALSAQDGALVVAAPLTGRVTAEGRLAFARVTGAADIEGTATLRARPTLRTSWRIDPGLHGFAVDIREANLRLGPVSTSARRIATRLAERYVERALPDLNAAIAEDAFLETAARRAFADLCRSHPVRRPDLPAIFVEVRPRRAIAAQPRITGEALALVIGIEAEIRISDSETRPDCPFPSELVLVDPPAEGPLAVAAPVELTFGAVNAALTRLNGRTVEDRARGIAVEIGRVTVRPAGTRLLVSAEVRARPPGIAGRLAGAFSGTVHALAEPRLDAETRSLRLRDVALDVGSREPLTAAFGGTAAALVEGFLAEQTTIDLSRELDRLNAAAETAVRELAARREGVRLDIRLNRSTLEGLAFDGERLRVTVLLGGTLRAEVVDIPLR
jgi:hypothetical protein